jgi:hypothetical protein
MRSRTGVAGIVAVAICCVSPTLTLALGGLAIPAWSGWADDIIVPVIVALVLLAAFGVPMAAVRRLGRVLRDLWHSACRFLAHW